MVNLASTTIKCIVRELTDGGTTTKTYDLVTDYGAVGDGVTNCDQAFLDYQTANANTSGNHRLYIPAGNYVVDLPSRYFADGFDKLHVLGAPKDGSNWTTRVTGTYGLNILGTNAQYADNLHSARIQPASQGAYTITVKNSDVSGTGRTFAQIMALFDVGSWIYITEYDTMSYGYPSNPMFCEYHQIVSKDAVAGTITLATPLTRAFNDTAPVFNSGDGSNVDHGGPATIYAVRVDNGNSPLDRIGTFENIEFDNTAGNFGVSMSGNVVGMTNCRVMKYLWPGSARQNIFTNVTVNNDIEVDKLFDYMEIDGGTLAALNFQSSHPTNAVIRNTTMSALVGTPRKITVEDSTISGVASIGCSFFGFTEEVTFTNCVLPSFSNINYRSYSLAGCTFTGGIVKGCVMQLDTGQTITGSPSAGQTLTGATSGTTAVVRGWDSLLKRINLDTISGSGFVYGETVTTATLTAAKVLASNIFGREWAAPGALIHFGASDPKFVCGGTVVSYYREGHLLCIETDRTSFPSYTDCPLDFAYINPCPSLTMTGCTGNDAAVGLSADGVSRSFGSYYRQWLTAGGVLSGHPKFHGKLVSLTVNVTKAYTGTQANLYWSFAGLVGIRLDGLGGGYFTNTNPPKFYVYVDLKTTGTRTFTPSGATGLVGGDVGDSNGYHFIFEGTSSGTLRNGSGDITISGESSSVWPAFTVTMITEPG